MDTYKDRKVRKLDPDDDGQMDAFNEEYSRACEILGVPRTTMLVTWEQAATYLGVSIKTVLRYIYAKPPMLEKERVGSTSLVVLDSLVEYKLIGPVKSGPNTVNSSK